MKKVTWYEYEVVEDKALTEIDLQDAAIVYGAGGSCGCDAKCKKHAAEKKALLWLIGQGVKYEIGLIGTQR